ncbi:unnamed protein product [Bemisia tabaci]|uniref:Heme haloperoxidase family profile domain-containing protein n=1 Tax=Bemisia tabaci TaxID=7038 RepID=A0A9P0EYZ6_BEMTA|nr:unnamed protein product [Bemisia tabaci]
MLTLTTLLVLTAVDQLAGHQKTFEEYSQALHRLLQNPTDTREKRQSLFPYFDKDLQHVQTDGRHKFVAPGPRDQRGVCPGLNALANHNYLPHNGVATINEFIAATSWVYGMGLDLASFLAPLGAITSGNGFSWSIDGPPIGLASLGLLGKGLGLSNSHNRYETDASPTRADLYLGNNRDVNLSQFQALLDTQANTPNPNYNLNVLTPFRARRFNESVTTNPYFFNSPFAGLLVQPAAYTFIYRFMANKSEEYPEGLLNREVLMSFFGVSGRSGNLTYRRGWERIPDNWYRRAIGDEYTIGFYLADVVAAALQYPQFLSVGGNTGAPNTFTGVSFPDLTSGVFNLETLFEGNNLACFLFQITQAATLDAMNKIDALTIPIRVILNRLSQAGPVDFTCPQLDELSPSLFNPFPGYTRLLPDGTYPRSARPFIPRKLGNATRSAASVRYEPPRQGLEPTAPRSQLWEFIPARTVAARTS